MTERVENLKDCIGTILAVSRNTPQLEAWSRRNADNHATWAYGNLLAHKNTEEAEEFMTWWLSHPSNPLTASV